MKNTIHPALEPFDSFNQKLRDNVHPEGWQNPKPTGPYNLVVIGAGTAGLVTAFGGVGLGAKVALIETHLLGGDCLNVGCVPSKALIRPARLAGELRRGGELGLKQAGVATFDFPQIMERMRRLRAGISPHDSAWRCAQQGIDLFYGSGRFLDSRTIEVNDGTNVQRLKFNKAVIASGARPQLPKIDGLAESGYLTNETIFSLTQLPKRLAIIGGGPIGCELAQAFARLGSQVTILQRQPQFLEREDADAAAILAQVFTQEGIAVHLDCQIDRLERHGDERRIFARQREHSLQINADALLIATGRIPNVDGLNLDAVGVQYDTQRGVYVNDYMQTTHPAIFAAGDVCLPHKFTHMADAMARLVLANALFAGRRKLSELVVPWCTYTDPEIAHVGMYEKEATAQGIGVDTFMTPFSSVDRAIVDGETTGFVKIHTRRGSDKILGATIVGSHAGDLVSEITVAMVHGVGLGALANVIHPYPTMAEAIRKTADLYNRKRLTPTIKRLFRTWLSFCR